MEWINAIFADVINWCYHLLNNYGFAIILFTFISKIMLLPVSLWTYFNSITMIKIQPEVNELKAKYFGQKDELAEAQSRLFKERNYHPMASVIPLILQLVLLIGVTGAIRSGINNPAINMDFFGVNLADVPSEHGLSLIWSPIIAGLSSLVLSITQNRSNVLQHEQSKYNQYGTMIFSVGLSLYLGWFVPVGVAVYWVFSNLFAVLQMYITNWIVKPRQYIDYERLEKSREELNALQNIGGKKKEHYFSENRRREREDYKKFFSIDNKHLVFYSESNGFFKYFKGYIEYILEHSRIPIHYITSDPNDSIFEMAKNNSRIKPYYIGGNKLITLMMKMDAQMVVMTMPDLENYHIKRSYVRKDILYVFVQHGIGSNNMGMRKGCVDHFDIVYNVGPHQREETEKTESAYNLPHKTLVDVGYPLIDEMRAEYNAAEHTPNEKKKILIAPSWQNDNIVDSCLEEILEALKNSINYEIIVRPHPQEVRLKQEYMNHLKEVYEPQGIEVQTDFSSNNPVLEADLLITDWSGISWEYAFTTLHPILFINTPMKVMNPEYQKIDTVPLNILLRNELGLSLDLDQLEKTRETVDYLLSHTEEYRERIDELFHRYIYNPGHSAEVGGEYILKTLQDIVLQRTSENTADKKTA